MYVTVGLVSKIQQRNDRNQPIKMETKLNKILHSVLERGVVLFFSWCGVPLLEGGAVPSRVPHHHSRLAVDTGLQELELGFGHHLQQ
jgi:hypothetical protein